MAIGRHNDVSGVAEPFPVNLKGPNDESVADLAANVRHHCGCIADSAEVAQTHCDYYHAVVARIRIGPVRVGGGRRASFTGNVGPIGITFGGRRKRRSGSGGGNNGHGKDYGPSEAEQRAGWRMAEKQWAEYCDYYRSLTPMERSIRDQWNLEMEHYGSISSDEIRELRYLLLTYLCAQSVVTIGLFNFGKFGWLISLLVVYLANQLYASKVSRYFEPVSEKAKNHSDWLIPVVAGITLIGFMFLPILLVSWENPTVNWLAFGFFNYAALIFLRGFLLSDLNQYFHVKKAMYERLTTHGYLNPWCLESVWYQVCASHLLIRNAKSGRYFAVSFWFPFLHFKRMLKGNKLGLMPFPCVAKPFVPYKAQMPEYVPNTVDTHIGNEAIDSYRKQSSRRK